MEPTVKVKGLAVGKWYQPLLMLQPKAAKSVISRFWLMMDLAAGVPAMAASRMSAT